MVPPLPLMALPRHVDQGIILVLEDDRKRQTLQGVIHITWGSFRL